MLDLVLQLNTQLKEMEKEMDKFTKQASLQKNVATVTTVVPSTLAKKLAPTVTLATALPATTPSTSATGSTTTDSTSEEANKLAKAREEMSLKANEIRKLEEKVNSLEIDCKLAQIMNKEEYDKVARITKRIKNLEKEMTLGEPLGQEKEKTWANIIESVNDILPSIQVIFEQTELVKIATESIQNVKEELGDKPEDAN